MPERAHLSIGEVLSLLQSEFPDITISKIRFLESQGLLDPERTPSGYRKFYEPDIERLRWILHQQKENFLPLRVIKDRLAGEEDVSRLEPAYQEHADPVPVAAAVAPVAPAPASSPSPAAAPARPPIRPAAPPAARTAPEPPARRSEPGAPPAARRAPDATPPPSAEAQPAEPTASAKAAPVPAPPRRPLDMGVSAVSLTRHELVASADIDERLLDELERYGLVAGRPMGRDTIYDEDALVVARFAASFNRYGVEARHLRMYKVSAEREAGFFEQVIMPLMKQRNPTARRQAMDNLAELTVLGEGLRAAMLRQLLKGKLPS